MFDLIFVPRGPEAAAVRRGLAHSSGTTRLFETGIGAHAAGIAVDEALARGGARSVLATGLCGLLSPSFVVGDRLIYGEIVPPAGAPLPLDPTVAARAAARLPGAQSGIRAYAGEDIVVEPARKRALGERYTAQAVDLESFAIARRLREVGIPLAVVKVASDGIDDRLPELERARDGSGGIDPSALALAFAAHPRAAARLVVASLRALAALQTSIARLTAARR
ncbi:MAG: hypothetical protein ACREM2_07780 [Vulcanimicrobiaceae bacterium]